MFAQFGAKVTVVDRGDTLMRAHDRDVADAVRAMLEERGVEFRMSATVERIDDDGGSATVVVSADGGHESVAADAVLIATGRRPLTAGLGLEHAGVDVDDRGYIVVDERLRTSAPGVFAVGDVNGGPQFTYISLDDHRIVIDQLAGSGTRSTNDRIAVPQTMFLTPPVATVGLNRAAAHQHPGSVLVASKRVADIAAMPRPKIVGEAHGIITVLVDEASDRILGATVFSLERRRSSTSSRSRCAPA